MRLVLIVPRFPRVSETFIVHKFAGLVEAGWDVHIVCGQASLADWDKFPALASRPELRRRVHAQWPHAQSWRVVMLWLPAFLFTLARAPRAMMRYWRVAWPRFGLRAVKQFYLDAAVIAQSPDILHFEFGALAVDRSYLKKALHSYLSASFRGYDLNYVGLEKAQYYDRVWEDTDAIHVLGSDLWRRAIRRGCPPDKPHAIIPPAIDVSYFDPNTAEIRRSPMPDQHPLHILSVGRLEWKKGYEYALQAVRLLEERGIAFEYRIIGDGNYLEPLVFLLSEFRLDARVKLFGSQPQPVVVEQMMWADVFLHAAVSEGFCNAVIEAQAMQLPVVSSDADGLRENVADRLTGFIVPRRDPVALADKLEILAGDADLRREMGAAGRSRVERCFALPHQIAAFDRFYREMVASHAH